MRRILVFLITIACSIAPAKADVLEVGREGAVWIAGGPIAPATPRPEGPTGVSSATTPFTAASLKRVPTPWKGAVLAASARSDISPKLLEALVWQESRWNPVAVSPAGAKGLAQLMPGTARGLGVNPDDPIANLHGGARYLSSQITTFNGDIVLALAAYNSGPNRVRRIGRVPRIPETRRYVASILRRLLTQ